MEEGLPQWEEAHVRADVTGNQDIIRAEFDSPDFLDLLTSERHQKIAKLRAFLE
jgi:hypothetical protein